MSQKSEEIQSEEYRKIIHFLSDRIFYVHQNLTQTKCSIEQISNELTGYKNQIDSHISDIIKIAKKVGLDIDK